MANVMKDWQHATTPTSRQLRRYAVDATDEFRLAWDYLRFSRGRKGCREAKVFTETDRSRLAEWLHGSGPADLPHLLVKLPGRKTLAQGRLVRTSLGEVEVRIGSDLVFRADPPAEDFMEFASYAEVDAAVQKAAEAEARLARYKRTLERAAASSRRAEQIRGLLASLRRSKEANRV